MSFTSGIYWVDLGFINNYKEPQLWLVILRYSADMVSAFPWAVTYNILGAILKISLFKIQSYVLKFDMCVKILKNM